MMRESNPARTRSQLADKPRESNPFSLRSLFLLTEIEITHKLRTKKLTLPLNGIQIQIETEIETETKLTQIKIVNQINGIAAMPTQQ